REPTAIIPKSLVSNDLQFIQGIIHYYLYRKDVYVSNEGLFLSLLILGEKQFKDVVEKLNKEFIKNNEYYIVIYLDEDAGRKLVSKCFQNCIPHKIVIRFENLGVIVKNIQAIIDLL
ncbi:MAG: hypothetical protein J7L82_01920, partial [Staphylothermus sp.]|nr:hypothetical protein [Staphylothermus sp.]